MPTDPDIIARFLATSFAPLPDFKSMDEAYLHSVIAELTGMPLRPKTRPRLYQLQGIAAALYLGQGLLFYDMQLGKTLCALTWAEHLKAAGIWQGTGLVIAHAPVALDVWEGQAAQHSDLKVIIVRTHWQDFVAAVEAAPDLIVMTWSGLQAIFCEKRPNRKKMMTLYPNKELLALAADCFELFIIDEIHKAKDPWGLWFALAEQIAARCIFRLGLTGTPLNRDAFAMWAQLKLIDCGERLGYGFSFFREAFGRKFINYKRGGIPEIAFDPHKMPLLSQRVASCSLAYSRAEAGIHIKLDERIVPLHMYGKQLEAYDDCINDVIRMLDGNIWSDEDELKQTFSRLRQISSGWQPFVDGKGNRRTARFPQSIKLEWLSDFLDELPGRPSVIIFVEHIEAIEVISEMLTKKKIGYARVYGQTTPAQDKKSIADFQAGALQVFLANHRSGGTSIMLNKADYLIFYETPASGIDRAQAQARPMADRGDRPLFVTDLCCSPVERRLLDFIAEGKNLQQELKTAHNRKAIFKRFARGA